MPFFLDGYNLIGRGRFPGLSLDSPDKERRLLDLVARYRDRKGVREGILVVFDGHPSEAGGKRSFSHRGIGVQYASGTTADDLLVRKVDTARHPRSITVVTSDAEVARRARLRGATTLLSEEFAAKVAAALSAGEAEKPEPPRGNEVEEWLSVFGKEREE